jgi:thioredoxin 1
MKKIFSATFMVALLLNLANCQNSNGQNESLLSPEAFATKLKKTPNAQVLDVRTPEEYNNKHLANAINININDANFQASVAKQLDKKKPVFLYCLAGGRSASAAQQLKSEGYEVYEMQGGLAKWQSAGLPFDLQPNAVGKKGISMADFEGKLAKAKITLVDFSATWCKPCKELKPIVTKLGTDMSDKLEVQIYDFDENPEVAQNFQIDALPTLLLFKEGKMVARLLGMQSEATLKKEIEKHL